MLMPFKEVKDLSLNNISLDTLKLWKKNDVFNKSCNKKDADSFIFTKGLHLQMENLGFIM